MSGTVIPVTVHKKNDFPQYRRLGKKKVTWGFMILFRPCLSYPEQGFFTLCVLWLMIFLEKSCGGAFLPWACFVCLAPVSGSKMRVLCGRGSRTRILHASARPRGMSRTTGQKPSVSKRNACPGRLTPNSGGKTGLAYHRLPGFGSSPLKGFLFMTIWHHYREPPSRTPRSSR